MRWILGAVITVVIAVGAYLQFSDDPKNAKKMVGSIIVIGGLTGAFELIRGRNK